MTTFEFYLIAFFQGLTEYLPISSSAHLNIFSKLIYEKDLDPNFIALIQIGTAFSLIFFFKKDIKDFFMIFYDLITNSKKIKNKKPFYGLIIATIPIGVVGILLKDFVDVISENYYLIASMLIIFGLVLIFAEKFSKKSLDLSEISYKTYFYIGLSQCLAIIPGVSRSGITTSTGLFMNLKRYDALKLSFLISIPAILSSGLYGLIYSSYDISFSVLIISLLISFTVGYFFLKLFFNLIAKNKLYIFGIYRIIFAICIFILLSKDLI